MKRIAAGREQHAVNFDAEVYEWLGEFAEDNNIENMGTAITALVDFYKSVFDEIPKLRQAAAEGEEAQKRADELEFQYRKRYQELDARENRLRLWEQQAADSDNTPYLPLQGVKSLLEAGLGVQDVKDLYSIIRAAGIPPADLAGTLSEMGGIAVLAQELQQAVETLQAKKEALSAQFSVEQARVKDTLTAAAMELQRLRNEAQEVEQYKTGLLSATDQRMGHLREYMGHVEEAYRGLGVCLAPVQKQLAGARGRIELLPLRAQLFLAGSILVMAEGLNGDQVFDIPNSLENDFSVRLHLSELPLLFAPREAYKEQRQLVEQHNERMAQYRQGYEDLLGGEEQLGEGEE